MDGEDSPAGTPTSRTPISNELIHMDDDEDSEDEGPELLKEGMLIYFGRSQASGKTVSNTGYFRVYESGVFGWYTAEEAEETEPRISIALDKIHAVPVKLDGRFDIVCVPSPSGSNTIQLCIPNAGRTSQMYMQAQQAQDWSDAIQSARYIFSPRDVAVLRQLVRPCLRVEESTVGEKVVTLDRIFLGSIVRRLELHENLFAQDVNEHGHATGKGQVKLSVEMAVSGLAVREDSHVDFGGNPALREAGDAVLRALKDGASQVEVLEVWVNERKNPSVPGKWDPTRRDKDASLRGVSPEIDPHNMQQIDGSKMPSAQMSHGLKPGFIWVCDWQDDCNPRLFGHHGWQYAKSFKLDTTWSPVPEPGMTVRRRRIFRVQACTGKLPIDDDEPIASRSVPFSVGADGLWAGPTERPTPVREKPKDIAVVLGDPVLRGLFAEYLQRVDSRAPTLLRFLQDSERVVAGLSPWDALIGAYFIPGRMGCVWELLGDRTIVEADDAEHGVCSHFIVRVCTPISSCVRVCVCVCVLVCVAGACVCIRARVVGVGG